MENSKGATTIVGVLSRLSEIIEESKRTEDRCGFFATLYYKVTAKVKEGIDKGQFQDAARMEDLDVRFANRYLEALATWRVGGEPMEAWRAAFEACRKGSVLVLQHLLLGISAHINLDLGIAAVETMKGKELGPIEKDFDCINIILGAMTYEVINEINRLSPLLSLLGKHSMNTESVLVQFSMTNARDGAWCFAEDLFKLSGQEYNEMIVGRDRDIAKLGHTLLQFRGMLRFTVWVIHLFECKDARQIIDVLQNYKKTFIHISGA